MDWPVKGLFNMVSRPWSNLLEELLGRREWVIFSSQEKKKTSCPIQRLIAGLELTITKLDTFSFFLSSYHRGINSIKQWYVYSYFNLSLNTGMGGALDYNKIFKADRSNPTERLNNLHCNHSILLPTNHLFLQWCSVHVFCMGKQQCCWAQYCACECIKNCEAVKHRNQSKHQFD